MGGSEFYHGTPTTERAQGILKHGLRSGEPTTYTHELRPADRRVYLTADPYYAIKYALGADARTRSHVEYVDRFCYVFEFDGATLCDIVPDEDSIGEFLWLNTLPSPDGMRGKQAWSFDAKRAGEDAEAKRLIWEFFHSNATAKELAGCCTLGPNRPYAWAAFGKRMQAAVPDWMATKLIDWGAHVAHGGMALPVGGWRLDREHQHDVANNPTRFFDLAERLNLQPHTEADLGLIPSR